MKYKELPYFIVAAFLMAMLSLYNIPIFTSLGLFSVFTIGKRFLNELGRTIPVVELIILVCGVQWIIGPFILYRIEPNSMYVLENEYMFITVIAYLFFIFGLLFFRKKKAVLDRIKITEIMSRVKLIRIIKKMYWTGLLFFSITLFFHTPLDFIFTSFYGFSFISAIMLLYSRIRFKYFYVVLIYLLLFLKCVYLAVFAEFISQSFLLVIFIPNVLSLNKRNVTLVLIVGISFLGLINTAKILYRDQVWSDGDRQVNIGLFFNVLFDFGSIQNDRDNLFLHRISSGTVNSEIFSNVPSNLSHTHGEILLEDFSNAIVPRFLYPGKKIIDTRKNYMLYTGRHLSEDTSVGINALGIGYGEFGVFGCFIFMFIFGFFLNGMLNIIVKYSRTNILYLFSIMFIFMGATKAETEFVGLLNGLLKTFVLTAMLIFFVSNKRPSLFVAKN